MGKLIKKYTAFFLAIVFIFFGINAIAAQLCPPDCSHCNQVVMSDCCKNNSHSEPVQHQDQVDCKHGSLCESTGFEEVPIVVQGIDEQSLYLNQRHPLVLEVVQVNFEEYSRPQPLIPPINIQLRNCIFLN